MTPTWLRRSRRILPARNGPEFQAAYAAMAAGCDFLIARESGQPGHGARPLVALRRAGNCLKELDRLLSILIDACLAPEDVVSDECASFSRVPDTARKLRRLDGAKGRFAVETLRLRAIARVRERACAEQVMAVASWCRRDMAVATLGHGVEDSPGFPRISERALATIAQFYLTIADGLRDYEDWPSA